MKTHWRKIIDTNYLGSFDLDNGAHGYNEMQVTIKDVKRETVKTQQGSSTELVLHFEGDTKPMILNVTNSKTISKLLKTDYIEEWVGNEILIGVDNVKAFGEVMPAIRVRNRLPVSQKTAGKCSECGKDISASGSVDAETIKKGTLKTYGVALCMACANKRNLKNETK